MFANGGTRFGAVYTLRDAAGTVVFSQKFLDADKTTRVFSVKKTGAYSFKITGKWTGFWEIW